MMRVSGVTSSGRDFVVDAEDEVFRFRFNLRGGAFSSERKAAAAGLNLAKRSAGMFLNAEIVSLAISAHLNRGEHGGAANRIESWADATRLLAMIVPNSHMGFSTGSGALDNHYHKMSADRAADAALIALKSAPFSMNAGEGAFFAAWGRATIPKLFGPASRGMDVIGPNLHKGKNAPALIGRAEEWRGALRATAMARATAHIADLVPVMKPAPRVIRGDRAASLMNLIVPRIEAQIELVADLREREELRARIDKLANRVAIEAANKSQARIVEDVRLSVAILEEQVEHRLPGRDAHADEPSP